MKKHLALLLFYFTLSFGFNAHAQIYGCTDPQSNNYNALATVNDGSCTYNSTNLAVTTKTALSAPLLNESSGLEFVDGKLWTFNDSGNPADIYRVDTVTNTVYQTVHVSNATNVDWEDMTSSTDYLFVGDFGNNNGNRQNLKIYRINKASLTTNATSVTASVINFSFSDQTSFPSLPDNNNFDCESMIFWNDSIHLFSKNWVDKQTRHYVLPNSPGTRVAQYRETYNAGFLVTGASVQQYGVIALVGYLKTGTRPVSMVMLYDYRNNYFFNGNKRKFDVGTELINGQVEGVDFFNSTYGYISNELFTSGATVPAALRAFNLAPYLPAAFVSSAPVANFTANNTTVCTNAFATFTDQSTNTPTSWQWSFAGGTPSTSTSQNPQVQYQTAGTFSVTLIAGNTSGTNTFSRTNYITVNTSPASSITAGGSTTFCSGSSVTMNANTGTGFTYQWKNNSLNISGATASSYVANASGVYSCVVSNSCGSVTSNTLTVTVNPLPTVTAVNVSGCSGTPIALSGTPASGTWSVANPYSGASTNYTHTYTDGNGCTNTSSPAIITVNSLPTVTAANVSGCSGTPIALSGTPAGGTWSVANPYSGASTNYTHTYTDGNGCTNTSSPASIIVNTGVAAAGAINGLTNFCAWLPIQFNVGAIAGATVYTWTVPAGATITNGQGTTQITVAFDNSVTTGNITVYGSNVNCTGASSTLPVSVLATPAIPFTTDALGCSGTPIGLIGNPVGGSWSVPNPYSGASTTFYYTVTNMTTGCSASSTLAGGLPNNITVNPLPAVTAADVSGCSGTPIALSGTPAGGTWSVANPYSGASTTYTHTYTDGNGCTNTSASAAITVNPCGCSLSVPASPTVTNLANTSATVNWTSATADSFLVRYYATGTTNYFYKMIAGASRSAALTGLLTCTGYNWHVHSYCNGASGAYNAPQPFTTLCTCTPATPGAPVATNISNASATLNWSSTTVDSFIVKYWATGTTAYQYKYVSPGTTHLLNVTGLSPCTQYTWQVHSYCSGASSPYTTALTFTTNCACATPTLLASGAITNNLANVSWNVAVLADSFLVKYWATGSSSYFYKWVPGPGGAHNVTLTGLTTLTNYTWQVRSQCVGVSYPYSATATFASLRMGAPDITAQPTTELLAYPNPATDNITIELPESKFTISITDAMGKLINQEKNIFEKVFINSENFPRGIYFVRAVTDEDSFTARVVLQ